MTYICVDFDGTIVDHVFPDIGKPAPGAIHWLKRFIELGAGLILFTMRSDNQKSANYLSEAVTFLDKQGVTLFGINHNPTQDNWTSSPKAYAHIYIDDTAFGCPLIHPKDFNRPCVDWSIVGPAVKERIKILP